MRSKIILIAGIVAGILVLGIVAYVVFGTGGTTSQTPATGGTEQTMGTVSGGVPANEIPAGDTIILGTSKGNVTVNNFYKNAVGIIEDSDVVLVQNQNYEIDYSRSDSSFAITLSAGPVASVQAAAENDLLRLLGASKPDVCKLSTSVIIPASVDSRLGGKTYPLSFCTQ